MDRMISVALLLVAVGCAGAPVKKQGQDPLVGHWAGAIDRDGWQRPLSLDIEGGGAGYGGSWMSVETQPGVMLDRVQLDGEAVHIELKSLSFHGRIAGRTLSGSVTDTASGAPSGQFTLTRVDPMVALVP